MTTDVYTDEVVETFVYTLANFIRDVRKLDPEVRNLLMHLDRFVDSAVADKDHSVEAGVRRIRRELGETLSKPPGPERTALDPRRPEVP